MRPEDIVAGQLAAYNQRDLEKFLSFFVDQVPIYSFPSGLEREDMSGPAFRGRYQRLFEESPALHAELLSRIVLGAIVIDHERITGFRGTEVREAVAMYQVGPQLIEKVWFVG
jgi:hypothetical protein